MTIFYTADLQCDHDDCLPDWVHTIVQHGIPPTKHAARKIGKRLGWTMNEGRDYCPHHSRIRAQEKQDAMDSAREKERSR